MAERIQHVVVSSDIGRGAISREERGETMSGRQRSGMESTTTGSNGYWKTRYDNDNGNGK